MLGIVNIGNNNHWNLAEDRGMQEVGKEWAGIFMINWTFGLGRKLGPTEVIKKSTKQYQREEFTIKKYLNLYHLLAFLIDWTSKRMMIRLYSQA